MLDAEKVRALARQRGTSESEAVRQAIEHTLAAGEVMASIRELHARGFADVFDRLEDDLSLKGILAPYMHLADDPPEEWDRIRERAWAAVAEESVHSWNENR